MGEGRRSDTGTSSWRSRRWHRHGGAGTRFEDGNVSQLAASAVPAHADVDSGHAQHQLLRGFLLRRFSLPRLSKQRTASGELPGSVAIGEQPVMAQAGEASRQHMQEEVANELVDLQPHDLSPVAVGVVTPSEPHVFGVEVDQPMVADGGLVGVAAQVGQDLTRVGERRLAVHHPVLGLQRCPEALERPILVGFVDAPQVHFALAVGAGKGVEVLAAEDLRQRGGGEQEPAAPSSWPANSAFLRFSASGRMVFSTALESISTRPSARNTSSPFQ